MRTHRKLTSHERDKIAYWYAVGESIREIARKLGRSPSSISDEIRRNKSGGRYHSIRAHQASEARKHNSVDRHVPADHLLRRVDAVLDLSFIRTSLAEHYSCTGCPSIDPELMIRMLLVGYLHGIRSETRLCEEVHLNLAYRWFCRLGLDGDVPERSTFSKNRHGRFREGDLFRRLFEEVVNCCVAAGLVGGTSAAVDGSVVEADASRERRLPGERLPEVWSNRESQAQPVREYLEALDAAPHRPATSPSRLHRSTSPKPILRRPGRPRPARGASVMRPTTWSTPPMR